MRKKTTQIDTSWSFESMMGLRTDKSSNSLKETSSLASVTYKSRVNGTATGSSSFDLSVNEAGRKYAGKDAFCLPEDTMDVWSIRSPPPIDDIREMVNRKIGGSILGNTGPIFPSTLNISSQCDTTEAIGGWEAAKGSVDVPLPAVPMLPLPMGDYSKFLPEGVLLFDRSMITGTGSQHLEFVQQRFRIPELSNPETGQFGKVDKPVKTTGSDDKNETDGNEATHQIYLFSPVGR